MNIIRSCSVGILLFTSHIYGLQKTAMRRSVSDDITVISINSVSFDEMRENLLSPLEVYPRISKKSYKRASLCQRNSDKCLHACTVLKLGAGALLVGAALYVASSLHSASTDLGDHLHTVVNDVQLIKDTFSACTKMIHVCTLCLMPSQFANISDVKES